MTKVEISGISKSYVKNQPVLHPLDLIIEAGELFFLLGPSGCGKSTLLRILAGLLEPSSGSIKFNDVDVTQSPPEKRHSAMVFQSYALWPHMTVFENVAFGLRANKVKKDIIIKEAFAALELVQLTSYAERKVTSLSGGQQQRVALARALAVQPALLLLDEPLSNLDARLRDNMRIEIRRITKKRNLTSIYVTHDRKEALSMADRIAVMNEGVIQQIGSPEEIYDHPKNKFVATFLGDVNFVEGKILNIDDQAINIDTKLGIIQTISNKGVELGEAVTVLLRPEKLCFVDKDELNTLTVEIVDSIFMGEMREWKVKNGEVKLTINESTSPPRKNGSMAKIAIKPEHISILKND